MSEQSSLWDGPQFCDWLERLWSTSKVESSALRQVWDGISDLMQGDVSTWPQVLDVGCGSARLRSLFPDEYDGYQGMDSSDEFVRRGKVRGISVSRGSIYKLPYVADSWPVVVSHAVLFHLDDQVPAIKELWRITRHRLVFSTYWLPNFRYGVIPRLHVEKGFIAGEDRQTGKQWPCFVNHPPKWMITRLVHKHLKPKNARFVWLKELDGEHAPIAFVILDK